MRYLTIYILTLFLPLTLCADASDPKTTFDSATELYKSEDYIAAAEAYEQLVGEGYQSFDLYFNLGNCYYREKEVAPCILYYEKAKKLWPTNEDVNHNLELANKWVYADISNISNNRIMDEINSVLVSLSSDGWTKLAVVFLWLGLLLGVAYVFINTLSLKKTAFFAAVLMVFLSITMLAIGMKQYRYETDSRHAIIFAKNIYLKSQPNKKSTDLDELKSGTKVRLMGSEDEWKRVKLMSGNTGWVLDEDLKPI